MNEADFSGFCVFTQFSGKSIPNLKATRASVDSVQIESYASNTVEIQ